MEVITEIELVNQEKNLSMAQMPLSAILNQLGITSPIIGVTKMEHMEEATVMPEMKIDRDYSSRI